jgi:hypothetical protein
MYVGRHMVCLNRKHTYHFRIEKISYFDIHYFVFFYLFIGKPLEISVRTKDRPHLYTTGFIPPRPHSTPTTDITNEIVEKGPFDKPHTFCYTSDSYLRNLRDNNEEDEEDSDPMSQARLLNAPIPSKSRSEPKLFTHRATQSRRKPLRSFGTMTDRDKTRNLGNERQPKQPLPHHPTKREEKPREQKTPQRTPYDTTFIGVLSPSSTATRDHQNGTISSLHPNQPTQLPRSRSSSPPIPYVPTSSIRPHTSPSLSPKDRFHQPQRSLSPSPTGPIKLLPSTNRHDSSAPSKPSYRTPSPPDRYRSTSPKDQQYPKPSTDRDRTTSAPPQNYARKPNDQSHTTSRETDPSLDAAKIPHHQGEQTETPSTRDYGTAPRQETKHQPQIISLSPVNTKPVYSQHQPSTSPLLKPYDNLSTPPHQNDPYLLRSEPSSSTRKSYILRPTQNDNYVSNYEEKPSKYDDSILNDHKPSFDRRKDYTPKPVIHDHQTNRYQYEQEKQEPYKTSHYGVYNNNYLNELPSDDLITNPSATVTQPDTFSRKYGQYQSSPPKTYDYRNDTGKSNEYPIRHDYQRRTAPIRDSPTLHIGTEKTIRQSPANEVAHPFQTNYVVEPNLDFRKFLKPDTNDRVLLLPVINSSRTYVFEKQSPSVNQIRQSRTNGNFYLASSPALHSLNSSLQVDESGSDPYTQTTDPYYLYGHELRPQVA